MNTTSVTRITSSDMHRDNLIVTELIGHSHQLHLWKRNVEVRHLTHLCTMSSSTEKDMKAIWIIAFSGIASDWEEWSKKFLALPAETGYADIISGTVVPPDDDAAKRNLLMARFLLTCGSHVSCHVQLKTQKEYSLHV